MEQHNQNHHIVHFHCHWNHQFVHFLCQNYLLFPKWNHFESLQYFAVQGLLKDIYKRKVIAKELTGGGIEGSVKDNIDWDIIYISNRGGIRNVGVVYLGNLA